MKAEITRCSALVRVHGRTLRCHWHEGHRGHGADMMAFHAARYQAGRADVLITWPDGHGLADLTVEFPHLPRPTKRDQVVGSPNLQLFGDPHAA